LTGFTVGSGDLAATMPTVRFITGLLDFDGLFETDRLTTASRISKDELASTTGIPRGLF
jgi:hypothetical protein